MGMGQNSRLAACGLHKRKREGLWPSRWNLACYCVIEGHLRVPDTVAVSQCPLRGSFFFLIIYCCYVWLNFSFLLFIVLISYRVGFYYSLLLLLFLSYSRRGATKKKPMKIKYI